MDQSKPSQSSQSAGPSSPSLLHPNPRRLFVRNLGYKRRKEVLIRYYTKFFNQFGAVEFFDVAWDHIRNAAKGYGFVTFKKLEDAERVLALTPKELYVTGVNKTVVVYPATQKTMELIKNELKELAIEREAVRQQKDELLSSPLKETCDEPEDEEAKKEEDEPKEPVENPSESPANNPEEKLSKLTINDLDDVTLLVIFDHFPVKERFLFSMVNSRFARLMETTWAGTTRLSFRESFCLWQGQTLDSNILFKVLKKCPGLKTLDFYQTATTFDDKTCDIIGRCCPLLEKLVIRDTALNKYSVTTIGKFCPNLKFIDFGKCENVTEKGLWGLFHLRPDLEKIILSNCELVTGRCFYLLNNLSYLDVTNCSPVLNASYSRLAQHCAKTLKVLLAPPMTNDGLSDICRIFCNLERLEVDQTALDPFLIGCNHLAQLTKLEKLIFRPELSDLNDENFQFIFSNLPLLRELTLFGNDNVTDASVTSLPEQCPNLKLINLEGFKFGDATIKSFVAFKNLESLTVSGSLITDEGVAHLLSQSPNLELLGVNSCLGISLKTLSNAYELITQGLVNKKLIICYNNCRIRISEFKDKDDVRRYESKDIWGSDEEYADYPDYEPEFDELEDYDHDFPYADYHNYSDEDDFIADGDLDFEEEELT
ncbi:F-box/LRR-repeat protein 7-like [Panonychus citri]|uniref:F-box/LRR-repeat protein 7-like n=1 Tax=Panonychus citri TaxID=50023 RepID=UPI0023079898|nr:F-box/LRR-repeat protein 7-like [Panonychus citri]